MPGLMYAESLNDKTSYEYGALAAEVNNEVC